MIDYNVWGKSKINKKLFILIENTSCKSFTYNITVKTRW
jgi:hypothetical protein